MGSVVAAVVSVSSGAALGSSLSSIIIGAVINAVVGIALSAVASSLFGKKPQEPSQPSFTPEAKERTQTIRSSIEPRRIVYGRIKVSGPLIFASSTGTDNKFLHMVVALAGHEVTAINDVFLDDKSSTHTSISSFVTISTHLGTDAQAADSDLVASVNEWTSAHTLSGIAYLYTKLEYDQDAFPGGAPGNFSAVVRGKKLLDIRDSTTAYSENPALMVHDYLTDTDYGLSVATAEIDSTTFIAAANVCEERVLLSTNNINFKVSSVSLNTMYQDTSKLEDIRAGDGVRLTTTGALPASLSAGVTYYFIEGIYDSSIDQTNFKLATTYDNAIAETAITITTSGTGVHSITKYDQVRYNCNGSFKRDQKPIEIIEDMLSCMGGVLVYSQGKYFVHAAEAGTSVKTFDEDDLRGPITIQPAPPKRDLFNAVRGTYVDPSLSWQPTDFPPLLNSIYEIEDGNERIWRDIEYAYTNNATRAQRISKIHLEKSRQGITVEMPCNAAATQVAVWDVVSITNTILGWTAKEFRVLEWNLDDDGGVNLTLQEEASASYDWANGDATIFDPAPNTTLPDLTEISPPGTPQITEELYSTTGSSGVKTKATVTWSAAPDGFIVNYEFQYKLSSDTTYIPAGIFGPNTTSAVVFDLGDGFYDFRVRSINSAGVRSSFATRNNFELIGLTAAPADINNFSLNAINNNAHLSWDQSTDLDVKVGGKIQLRYSTATSSATWNNAIDLGPALSGIATNAVVPLLAGTYLIKAVDSTNNESVNAAVITSTIADIVDMNLIELATESTSFTGVKTRMVVVGSVLRLDGALLFDDATGNFDDAGGLFDTFGGSEISGIYDFATQIDVGKVTTCRATATLGATAYDYTTFFDQHTGNFDDASGFFDGDQNDITAANATLYLRTTQDDPLVSGGPTWTEWRQFFVGDYTAQAFEFQLRATSVGSSYNIDIDELTVSIDVPDIVDAGTLTTSSGGLTTVTYNKTFVIAAPRIAATIQDGATGDYLDISSIGSTSFDIGVRDSGTSLVVRNLDWLARGY